MANSTHDNGMISSACSYLGCSSARGNVGETERLFSMLGGAIVGLAGLNRRSWDGVLLVAAGGALIYRGVTGYCSVYEALGVSSNDDHPPATAVPAQYGAKVEKSITIRRSAHELFTYWRQFSNLPHIMRHLQSVRESGGGRSHWVARGPLGVEVEWDAEVINEDPGRLIAWRSLPGSEVDTAGSVHFDEQGSSTRLTVSLKYNPPGGKVGAALAWLAGSGAEQEIEEDLHRFKELMESGTPTTSRSSD